MIDNENEEANQNKIVKYIHDKNSEKGLIANSFEYAGAYENYVVW